MCGKTLFIAFCCVGLLLSGLAYRATACVCSPRGDNEREDAEQAFAEAAVVFEGDVASARTQGEDVIIMFKVTRAYKGLDSDSIEVIERYAYSDCGFGQPHNGMTFFIYGFRDKSGKISIGSCRPIFPRDAGADIRYARGEAPTDDDLVPFDEKFRLMGHPNLATQGSTLRGKVVSLNPPESANTYVTVWEVDEKGRRENLIVARQKVQPDGSFKIKFIPAGTYFVTAEDHRPTSKGRGIGEFGKISLAEKQILTIPKFRLRPDPLGSITVHVTAPQELNDRIFVWVREAITDWLYGNPYFYAQTSQLNEKGVAHFTYVPYGTYNIYVQLTGDTSDKPSWTHEQARIVLRGDSADFTVTMKKAIK